MVPAPPPGPGVRAPFVTPPTERDRKRMWIGLGVGGALLVLCCVGGLFAFGALVVAGQRAVPNEARIAVTAYLDGLKDHDYHAAYDRLCTRIQQDESYEEFAGRQRDQPDITSYSLDEPVVEGSSVMVGATISRTDGAVATVRYTLISDQQAGELRICGAGP